MPPTRHSIIVGTSDPPVVVDSHIAWTAFDGARIVGEAKRGRPVFLDFTAEWCASCKANEHAFLETDTVRGALVRTNILPMRADMTNESDELDKLLESIGRAGIPAYVLLLPDGTRDLLPVTITAEMVATHLADASKRFPAEKFAAGAQAALSPVMRRWIATDRRNMSMRLVLWFVMLAASACGGEADNASGAQQEAHRKGGTLVLARLGERKGQCEPGRSAWQVVLVDFWATWCGPCKESFPKLQELYTKFQGSGVEFVGLSQDDENQGIAEFGKAHGAVQFPIGWDSGKAAAGKYKPPTMPTSFVIDKSGIVRFAHVGYHDNDQAEIEKELKSLM